MKTKIKKKNALHIKFLSGSFRSCRKLCQSPHDAALHVQGCFLKLKTDSPQRRLEGRENPGVELLFINHLLQSLE